MDTKLKFSYKGKFIEIKARKMGFFGKIKGLMFKSSRENLLFEFSSDTNKIKIKKIEGNFGESTFKISANIYKNQETKEKIEPKQKSKEKK